MADYYYKSDVTGPGTGTSSDPFKDLTSGPVADGNRYFLHTTSSWASIPQAKLELNSVTFDQWGPAGMPTISGLTNVATGSWTYDAATGLFYAVQAGATMVIRGGQMLTMVQWPSGASVATVAATMPVDSFAADYSGTDRIYIRISGAIGDAPLMVNTGTIGALAAPATLKTGVIIKGIRFTGFNTAGMRFTNITPNIQDCEISNVGGLMSSGAYTGIGIDLREGTGSALINQCRISYCYLAGLGIQNFNAAGTNPNSIQSGSIQNLSIYECGSGVLLNAGAANAQLLNNVISTISMSKIGAGVSSWIKSGSLFSSGAGLDIRSVAGATINSNSIDKLVITNALNHVSYNMAAAGSNTIRNSKFIGGTNGLNYARTAASAGLTITGTVFSGITNNMVSSGSGAGTITMLNNTIVGGNGLATNTGVSVVLKNSLIQNVVSLASGSGSVTSNGNYITNGSSLGTLTLGGADRRGADVKFDSGISFMPVSTAVVFTGGEAQGSTYSDVLGSVFGTSSVWSSNAYQTYQANSTPASSVFPTKTPSGLFTWNSRGLTSSDITIFDKSTRLAVKAAMSGAAPRGAAMITALANGLGAGIVSEEVYDANNVLLMTRTRSATTTSIASQPYKLILGGVTGSTIATAGTPAKIIFKNASGTAIFGCTASVLPDITGTIRWDSVIATNQTVSSKTIEFSAPVGL